MDRAQTVELANQELVESVKNALLKQYVYDFDCTEDWDKAKALNVTLKWDGDDVCFQKKLGHLTGVTYTQ